LPLLADLWGRETLVDAVIPFADLRCDLYVGVCARVERAGWGFLGPGEAFAAAEVEEFEGALGAGAWGYVAVMRVLGIEALAWFWKGGWGGGYMCARLLGTIKRSSPTRAFPVARMRFSPLAVRGMSVVPVWRPLRDHSVSPWRIMKTRGSGILGWKL
jgi:hypothetical protein